MTEKSQNKALQPLWKRILVPVSFAPSSKEALKTAFDIACRQGGELFVLHVAYDPIIQSEAGIGTFSLPGDWPRELERRRRQLDRLVAEHLRQARRDLPVTKLIVEGNPERRILEIAREQKIDLIVLGHHEEDALERFFLGRNIDRIVHHADCAVLIIRIHLFQEEKNTQAVVDESIFAVSQSATEATARAPIMPSTIRWERTGSRPTVR